MASKKTPAATACECSLFDAVNPAELTEERLSNGDYAIAEIGCVATTKNTFAPGHDAKLKSFLIKQGFAGWDVRRSTTVGTALGFADSYGFGTQVRAGIAKLQAKADAKANRATNKPAKAVAGGEAGGTTHRSYQPTPEAVAANLAEIVAAEEAKHAADLVASRPAPEWEDEKPSETPEKSDAPVLEDEAAMHTGAREERERDLVVCKVGRWENEGFIDENDVFHYVTKSGERKETKKFVLMRNL